MEQLLPFFIVLFAGVFFAEIFGRLHLPWVVALIVGGMVMGPFGFELFDPSLPTLDFIAKIGLVFLMFMAGLETKLSSFKAFRKGIFTLALVNAIVPFAVGFAIGLVFGFDKTASLLIGIIFVSSSIAVVVPSLESNRILHSKLGRSIVSATITEDILSLVLLSVFLQTIDPVAKLPLPLFYAVLLATLLVLRWLIKKISWLISISHARSGDIFREEVRSIMLIVVGVIIAFEFLGLHPIIAGFFAGLVLSESITSSVLMDRLKTISYGLFIPTFFVIVGAKADITIFTKMGPAVLLTAVIAAGSMASKFLSGWTGGVAAGFSGREGVLIGAATMPQLSTTLAVVFSGVELGLLPPDLLTAMVVLSIITTFVAPILIRSISSKIVILEEPELETRTDL